MEQDYYEFRRSLGGKVKERLSWKDWATFVPNKKLHVYNWFYYKEGFSKQLVDELVKMFGLHADQTVLDPFCGVGTTLLACRQRKINAVGYDVLPISVFAARVKTQNYGTEKLKTGLQALHKARFRKLNVIFPHLIRRAFNKYALEDIAFLRSEIRGVDPSVREFFTLALINAAMKCSCAYKDGSVIKFRKRGGPPLRKMFSRVARNMIKDAEKLKEGAAVIVELQDARHLPLEDRSIDAIITSPPYLNQIDYTKVYAVEEFFIHSEPLPGVRAYIGAKAKDTDFLLELNLPVQARLYFEDMDQSLKEMHRVLKIGGFAGIVVGNGYVSDVIESDIILSYLAGQIGFRVVNIFVLNKRFALEERTVKKGVLRESLIILQK